MVYIAFHTELNCFVIKRKNDAFVAKIVNTCIKKIFMAIFALDERLPTSATLFVFCFAQVDESHRRDVPSPAESGAKADNSDQLPP